MDWWGFSDKETSETSFALFEPQASRMPCERSIPLARTPFCAIENRTFFFTGAQEPLSFWKRNGLLSGLNYQPAKLFLKFQIKSYLKNKSEPRGSFLGASTVWQFICRVFLWVPGSLSFFKKKGCHFEPSTSCLRGSPLTSGALTRLSYGPTQ